MASMVTMTTCCVILLSLTTPSYGGNKDEDLLKEIDDILSLITEKHQQTGTKGQVTDSGNVMETEKDKRRWGFPVHTSKRAGDPSNTRETRGRYTEQCAEGYVPCGGIAGAKCIRAEYLCDGFVDCYADSWDEDPANCGSVHCPHGMLKCNGTGRCINRHDMCNEMDDCGDLEDENVANCGKKRCDHGSTKCPDTNLCLSNQYWCDGEEDCPSGADESVKLCQHIPCDGVRCNDGKCISGDMYCDGFADCRNGEDEDIKSCGPVKCRGSSVQCGEANYCYKKPRWRTCDGHNDCPNGYDELEELCPSDEPEASSWYHYDHKPFINRRSELSSLLNRIIKQLP